MHPPLPVATYLFILRKHAWLVLGGVLVVLGAGFWYARSLEPSFRATATVLIQPPAVPAGADKTFVVREDPVFVSNLNWRIRRDPALAEEVLAHLLGQDRAAAGAADGTPAPGPRGAEPEEPPLPDPALFRGLSARSLPGMVTISNAPPTSYWEISVRGREPAVNTAVANAYAVVFARTFRRERERLLLGNLDEYRAKADAKRKAVAEADDEIRRFKEEHAGKVDFEKGVSALEQETLDFLRKDLTQARSRASALGRELEAVRATLKSAGLVVTESEGAGFEVALAGGGGAASLRDALLDERVQTLDAVAAHDGVRREREALGPLDEEKRRLGVLREGTPEAKLVQERIEERRAAQARNTAAAIAKLAQDAARAKRIEEDLESRVQTKNEDAAEQAKVLARLERLAKAASAAREEMASLQGLVLEGERARERIDADGGSVRVHLFARIGEAELVAPNKPVIYAATIIAALLLVGGLAWVLEYLDDTVKTREDFDRLVRLPFLGYVPHLKEEQGRSRDLTVARGRTGSPEVESFRAIRTGVQFSRPDREVRTFLVTSSGAGEGKTTVTVNLAAAFAGGKGRVLLVDADLRRARVHSALGIDNSRGLTHVLVGESTLAESVQRSSIEGLDVLSSGPIPPNPAEVLGSERMQELLREAAEKYERVLVDSPPLVAVTDPALLAKYVDAVFLVISIGKTSIRTIQRARETLATVGASIHGAVLNNADVKVSGYYQSYGGYGYGYGYGERRTESAPKT
jgi:capsular exopolysaccharide synthesis family protein